jgi:membrane-associated phospholipid phosphatase
MAPRMNFVTDFADQAVVLPLALAVGVALLVGGWRRGAVAWMIAVAGTLGVMLVAKVLVHACIGAAVLPGLRSPSGHTASAAVVYGGLATLLLPVPAWGLRRMVIALLLAAGFALVFGSTRLALHMHTLSDVIAGGSVGIAGGLVLNRLAGTPPRRMRAALPIAAAAAMALLFHGLHLHAEAAIDRLSCPIGSGLFAARAAASTDQPASARP